MHKVPVDAWIALVLLVVCGFLLNDLLATEGSGAFVKTTTLPTGLVIVLGGLALLLLGGSLLRPAASGVAAASDNSSPRSNGGLLRVVAMVAWTAIYIAALPWTGYLATTAAFLIGANLLFGNRRPGTIVAVSVIIPILLLLFFEKFMVVLLPSARLLG